MTLDEIFKSSSKRGKTYIDVNSGDLHRKIGGCPSRDPVVIYLQEDS